MVENVGTTANWCSHVDVRIFAATLIVHPSQNFSRIVENCPRELSKILEPYERSTRLGTQFFDCVCFCCRIFFGLSDHDSFKEIGPELKKVEKQNKNRRRRPEGVAEAQEA